MVNELQQKLELLSVKNRRYAEASSMPAGTSSIQSQNHHIILLAHVVIVVSIDFIGGVHPFAVIAVKYINT